MNDVSVEGSNAGPEGGRQLQQHGGDTTNTGEERKEEVHGGNSDNGGDNQADSAKPVTSERQSRRLPDWLLPTASNDGRQGHEPGHFDPLLGERGTCPNIKYVAGFNERVERIYRQLQSSDGQLVRDIFRFVNDREREDFIKVIRQDVNYSRGVLLVCRDDGGKTPHVHVVHDCAFTNGQCRCAWFKKIKTFGFGFRRDRSGHRRNPSRSRRKADVENILIYYATSQRKTCILKVGGTLEVLLREGVDLEERGPDQVSNEERSMEVQVSGIRAQLREKRERSPLQDDDFTARPCEQKSKKARRNRMGLQEQLQLRIVNMVKKHPIAPPEAIVMTRPWREDEDLRFKNCKHQFVTDAFANLRYELVGYTLADYQKLYGDENTQPIFCAVTVPFEDYYYSIENSVKIMDELIQFQCDYDDDGVIEFYTALYNVLERKKPKFNAIVIHSDPTSGKNFFFDAITHYFMNTGHLTIVNKNNNFGFMDAEGRRVVWWNEPNYSPENINKIKELFAGDFTVVNIKYGGDMPVYRTPFIVTTNDVVSFMTNSAFSERLQVFRWKPAPFLYKYDKKPNPLATYFLFKKYGLVE